MKCLVTGGAGFIGSHLVDALVAAGHEVRILDNLSSGRLENIRHHGNKVELIEGDLRDWAIVQKACQGSDIVFHKAAIASVSQSLRDPQGTYEVNILGTGNIFEAAGAAGVKRFVFASTAAVYSQSTPTIEAPITAHTEEHPVQPISQYGLSKLIGEQYGRFYSEFFNMQVTCLRYFNVFGARQSTSSDYAGVISLFVNAMLEGKPLRVFGDGLQSRDFINVADIVQANLLAMQAADYQFNIMNVGTGRQTTLQELISQLGKIADKPLSVQFEPERRGELRHSLSDISRACQVLKFEPRVSLYDGLLSLVNDVKQRTLGKEGLIQAGDAVEPCKAVFSA